MRVGAPRRMEDCSEAKGVGGSEAHALIRSSGRIRLIYTINVYDCESCRRAAMGSSHVYYRLGSFFSPAVMRLSGIKSIYDLVKEVPG